MNISIIAILFTSILIGIGVFVTIHTLLYSKEFVLRSNIEYDNFSSKEKYYQIRLPQMYYVFFMIYTFVILFSTAFILTSSQKEYLTYLFPITVSIVMVAGVWYMWNSLGKRNIDITYISQEYVKIQESLNEQKDAIEIKKATIKVRSNIKLQIALFCDVIDNQSWNKSKIFFPIYNKIDLLIDDQEKNIDGYEERLIIEFNKQLNSFLTTRELENNKTEAKIMNFKQLYYQTVNEITNDLRTIYSDIIIKSFEKKNAINVNNITNIFQFMNANEIEITEDIIIRLFNSGVLDNIDSRGVVEFMLSEKLISMKRVIDFALSTKKQWYFTSNILANSEHPQMVCNLLVLNDDYSTAETFVSNNFNELMKLSSYVKSISTENRTSNLFKTYANMVRSNNVFFAEEKIYDNMYYSLKEFFNRKSTSAIKSSFANVSNKTLSDSSERLIEIYDDVLEYNKNLQTLANKLLLKYNVITNTEWKLLDDHKLVDFVNSQFNRLHFESIVSIEVIIYGIILINTFDKDEFLSLNDDVDLVESVRRRLSKVNKTLTYANRISYGKSIIKDVLSRDMATVNNIITATENNRQSKDLLMKLVSR